MQGISPKLEFTTKSVIRESLSPEVDALEDALEEERVRRTKYIASISIDQFEKWKPHKSVYLSTCKLMNINPKNTLMIAAHGWDINGAKLAGLKTAYITRYEKKISNFYLKPDYIGKDSFEIVRNFFI